ncbi:MAG: hypothetical protein PVSMB10_17100 [Pseudarthrobacter sp.]
MHRPERQRYRKDQVSVLNEAVAAPWSDVLVDKNSETAEEVGTGGFSDPDAKITVTTAGDHG